MQSRNLLNGFFETRIRIDVPPYFRPPVMKFWNHERPEFPLCGPEYNWPASGGPSETFPTSRIRVLRESIESRICGCSKFVFGKQFFFRMHWRKFLRKADTFLLFPEILFNYKFDKYCILTRIAGYPVDNIYSMEICYLLGLQLLVLFIGNRCFIFICTSSYFY